MRGRAHFVCFVAVLAGALQAWAACGGSDGTTGGSSSGDMDSSVPPGVGSACGDCTDAAPDVAAQQDADADAGPADSGNEGAAPGFCAQHSYLFCDDFDTPGATPQAAFDGGSWASTILSPTGSAVTISADYALSSPRSGKFTAAADVDASNLAQLQTAAFTLPVGTTHLQYGYSFRMDADATNCTMGFKPVVATWGFGSTTTPDFVFSYEVERTMGFGANGIDQFGFLQAIDLTAPVWWTLVVDLYLPGSASSCGFNGAATHPAPCFEVTLLGADGGTTSNGDPLPPSGSFDASILEEAPWFQIGVFKVNATAACSVYIDNVFFDAK